MRGEQGIKKLLSELILTIPTLNAFNYELPDFESNKQELELGRALHLRVYLLIKQVFVEQRHHQLLSQSGTLG